MQLFISYASEDKNFAHPLADALRRVGLDVWIDKYELTMGDSLRRKINEGLAASDYGVVILSPPFFRKKWPQAELDGLFELETESRKMILPVWKDIDHSGVKAYSPILAGRLASIAGDGISHVVAEIQRAIGIDQRRSEMGPADAATAKLRQLASTLKNATVADGLLRSEDGVGKIQSEFNLLCTEIEARLNVVSSNSEHLKFKLQRPMRTEFSAHGPFRVTLRIQLLDMSLNWAEKAKLECTVNKMGVEDRDGRWSDPRIISSRTFAPYFDERQNAVWSSPNTRDDIIATTDLVGLLLEMFVDHIDGARRGVS